METAEPIVRRRNNSTERTKNVVATILLVPILIFVIYTLAKGNTVSRLVITDQYSIKSVDVTRMNMKPQEIIDALGEPLERADGVSGPGSIMLYYEGASFFFGPSQNDGGSEEALLNRIMITGNELKISQGSIGVGAQRSTVQSVFRKNDRLGGDGESWDVYLVGSGASSVEAEFIYDPEGLISAITITRPVQ